MQVCERWVHGVAVVDVAGTLTSVVPNRLKEAVSKLARRGDKRIVLNLRDVPYADSGGLGLLVACYTRATRDEAAIVITNACPRVRQVLEVTNLVSIFQVFESESDAIASFAVAA